MASYFIQLLSNLLRYSKVIMKGISALESVTLTLLILLGGGIIDSSSKYLSSPYYVLGNFLRFGGPVMNTIDRIPVLVDFIS